MSLYKHEMKLTFKSLIIWILCVGGLCLACIPLYTSVQDSMKGLADTYSNMGALSVAFGMDKISLDTLTGFYATEIAIMISLGGAMYAAIMAVGLVSKEESMHTSEFLNTLPVGRIKILTTKYLSMISNLLLFNIVCDLMYVFGFILMNESIPTKAFIIFHVMQFLLQLEIGSICFLISSLTKKNLFGPGIGVAFIFYAIDIMCRIVPDIKNLKYITPFYFSNGADIFTNPIIKWNMVSVSLGISFICFIVSLVIYNKKDLAV